MFAFLEMVCGRALDEAQQGDLTLVNRLGQHPALAHYFDNVHTRKALSAADWAVQHPAYARAAARFAEAAEQETAEPDVLAALTERVAALEAQMAGLRGESLPA